MWGAKKCGIVTYLTKPIHPKEEIQIVLKRYLEKIILFSTIEKSVGKEIKMLNDINGYTRTCGLIGNPVEHTLSPVIHNTLSMVLGKNLAYVPFHVETGRLEDAVKGAFALNLFGNKCNGSL